jgi:hypothetical protein
MIPGAYEHTKSKKNQEIQVNMQTVQAPLRPLRPFLPLPREFAVRSASYVMEAR